MYRIIRLILCSILMAVLAGSVDAQNRRRILEHLVKEKDTVYSIALHYDTTVEKVYEINSWARNGIKVGDKLIIYTGEGYKKGGKADTAQHKEQAPAPSNRSNHIIEPGETLYGVSRRYGLTEEEMMQANPGISANNFQVGAVLRIVKPGQSKRATQDSTHQSREHSVRDIAQPEARSVRLLVMLPFRKAARYLEFYQGFLMGMNDLKKDGININLTALEADDDDAITRYIYSGAVRDYDFLIGGVNEEQCRQLAQANRLGYYIVPFTEVSSIHNPRLIQLNQNSGKVIERVIPQFIKKYAGRSVIFARRDGDSDDAFAIRLKVALNEAGIAYQHINITNSSLSMLGSDQVVVPCNANKGLAESVFTALGNNRHTPVFGYPQWQSYGDNFTQEAHKYQTTFYSTFYFDKFTSESKQFLTKFNAWFNKKVLDSYPKYSVLGYDVARYFIRAYAAYGNGFMEHSKQLPSDGLQMDIELERSGEHDGYTNSRFYFVTYAQDGSISRESF